jgi:hypothetical protein
MLVFAIVGIILPFICKLETCLTEKEFKSNFADQLRGREIKDLIRRKNYLDEGSYGVVHKIEWEKEEGPNRFLVLKQQLDPRIKSS